MSNELEPIDKIMMEEIEAKSKPVNANRRKCWMCGQWQAERYMVTVTFNELPEQICVQCNNKLRIREDALEGDLREKI
jgi:hypothetical protein